jgi:type III pantothenate kinase
MSLLLLDIGNSRLKWVALAEAGAALPPAQAIAHAGAPADAVQALAAQWQGRKPNAVYLAHVTGRDHEAAIVQAVQQGFACTTHCARSLSECAGLKSAYAEPARLGVDRWLALLALWLRNRQAFGVASAGTALTFDAVDSTGQHLGGVIAPGLHGLISATLSNTRFAVNGRLGQFDDGLGTNTESCVQQGALHAAAGLLDRLASRYSGPKVLAGGDAKTLQPLLQTPWQLEPDVVLQGLASGLGLLSRG